MTAHSPPATTGESPYAGIVSRGIAFLLDSLVVNATLVVAGVIIGWVLDLLGDPGGVDAGAILAGGIVWLSIWGAYLTGLWALSGQTVGMWWMRIAVEDAGGGPIGWGRAFTRAVGTGLAVLPFFLGFLPILFSKRRRAVNDMLADTVVVYRVEERDTAAEASWAGASGADGSSLARSAAKRNQRG